MLPISLFSLVTFIFLLCVQQTRNMSFLISTPRLGSERSARARVLAGPLGSLPGRTSRALETLGDVTDGSRGRVGSRSRPWPCGAACSADCSVVQLCWLRQPLYNKKNSEEHFCYLTFSFLSYEHRIMW